MNVTNSFTNHIEIVRYFKNNPNFLFIIWFGCYDQKAKETFVWDILHGQ